MRFERLIVLATAVAVTSVGAQGKPVITHPSKGGAIVCKLSALFDPYTHMNAFTYLIPKGWTATNNLAWRPSAPGQFMASLTAVSPNQRCIVSQLEREIYTYGIFYDLSGRPTVNGAPPVHHATDFLHAFWNRMSQSRPISGGNFVDEVNSPLPEDKIPHWSAKGSDSGFDKRVPCNETGFLQIEFMENGQPMTAEMGTTISGSIDTKTLPNGHRVTEGGVFSIGPTTLLIMPKDVATTRQREMRVIAGTMQMTSQFRGYLNALGAKMARIQLGANAVSQRYAASTFHERAMSQFSEQMHMKDAYSHAFCNYVSDLQDYKDRSGTILTGPASFKYAWSDGSGDYLFADDPRIDLAGAGNGNWRLMDKARIGE
jgi:hypothetical protein